MYITAAVLGPDFRRATFAGPVRTPGWTADGGIADGTRLRTQNLRGASALAYEADTVLMLNNKFDVVARHHLVYDSGNVERFRHWAVLTVEKNRSGLTGVDMEFPKRFEQSRFETRGQLVREKLVDERVFIE